MRLLPRGWLGEKALRALCVGLGSWALIIAAWADASPMLVRVAVPGPGSFNYLPIELIPQIGADRAEGLVVKLRFFSGGPLAQQDMLKGGSDFSVTGAPALADMALRGEPVVSVAAVTRRPAFVLMVASRHKHRVKTVKDLKGLVVGINSSNTQARSTSQQMVEYVLRQAGLDPEREVNFLAAGQNFEEQRSALKSGAVDALMGDEPFATQLGQEGVAYPLLDLHDAAQARAFFAGDFLYAQLATRRALLQHEPEKVARMVRALRRTLQWLARSTPEEIAARLPIEAPASRAAMLEVLRRHKSIFSPDGAFERAQIEVTESFYRRLHPMGTPGSHFAFATMIDPRYSTRDKP